jgi:uncharacterized membrane protein
MHSRTARRLTAAALALAAALATASAASAASADEPKPEPAHAVDQLVPGPAAADLPADTPAPAGPPALALGASVVQDQGAWDYVRLFNQGRVVSGQEPAIPSTRLSRIAADWALGQSEAGTTDTDPDLDAKLPAGWTGGQHAIYRTLDYDPLAAARTLADQWLYSDWLHPDAPRVTDVGIGLVEQPWVRDQKRYTLYVIGVVYPHSTAQVGESTLYRFSRPDTGTHFYSTSAAERDSVIGNPAFRYEGPVAYVLQPSVNRTGTGPLNRFYRPGSGTHFYTSTPAEYARVLGFPQYSLDGAAGKVYTSGGTGRVPMYRFFRPASGTHFYTANAAEMERVKTLPGYTFEGTAFFLRRAS